MEIISADKARKLGNFYARKTANIDQMRQEIQNKILEAIKKGRFTLDCSEIVNWNEHNAVVKHELIIEMKRLGYMYHYSSGDPYEPLDYGHEYFSF